MIPGPVIAVLIRSGSSATTIGLDGPYYISQNDVRYQFCRASIGKLKAEGIGAN